MKKRRYIKRKNKHRILLIKTMLMTIGVIVIINYAIAGVREVYDYLAYQPVLAVINYPKIEERELTVIEKIVKYSKQYGVNPDDALRIAYCESRFKPNAKNGVSTAKGLYQFLDGTWENYCQGDRYNVDDSIKCFMELYPKYPNWWACK